MDGKVRLIQREDTEAVASIIKIVMPEFGAGGKGFAIHDDEVNNMFQAYDKKQCAYFVCELDGVIVGGGGIAPLIGGDGTVCELKKMYFLKHVRGRGFGQQVLKHCITAAREVGFTSLYLETFNTMTGAMKLYERSGFHVISKPLGNTGHFACDRFYLLELQPR